MDRELLEESAPGLPGFLEPLLELDGRLGLRREGRGLGRLGCLP